MSTGNVPRPGRYPYHAESITIELPTVSEEAGYVGSTIANPNVANALGQSAGRWIQQMDLAKWAVDDWVDRNVPWLVRGLSLEYPTGVGLVNLTPEQTPVVVGQGCRIPFDSTVLSIGGANPITFAASSRTWIYGSPPAAPGEYPGVRIETVALATPAAPQSGEVVLGGVDTDGSTVVANLPSTLGTRLTIDISLLSSESITLDGTGTMLDIVGGSGGTVPAMAVDGKTDPAATFSSAVVTGGTVNISNSSGVALNITSGGAEISGGVLLNAALQVIGPTVLTSATFSSTATFNGLAQLRSTVQLGDAPADAITVNGTMTVAGPMSIDGDCEVKSDLTVLGAVGGSIISDPTAILQWNGEAQFTGRLRVLTGTSVAEGDLSKSSGYLRYRDSSSTKFVDTSVAGHVKGLGIADGIGPAATAQLSTTASVAPQTTADLDVHATFWVQRAVAGDVTVSLEQVGGIGQIGTSTVIAAPVAGTTNWLPVVFSRRVSGATTTPYTYRLSVNGGGQNVTLRNSRIAVTPAD